MRTLAILLGSSLWSYYNPIFSTDLSNFAKNDYFSRIRICDSHIVNWAKRPPAHAKKGNPESNCKCILNFLCSLLKNYSNQTVLCLITVSCLLSRAELLLLLVHHDLATSSFTFTHPLWPLPDSEISNTFFFFSFFSWSNSLCKYFSCQKHRMFLFLLSKFK